MHDHRQTGADRKNLKDTRVGVLTNRRSCPNELIFLIRNKKASFQIRKIKFLPGTKKVLYSRQGHLLQIGLPMRLHGIDSVRDTKAVSLNRFYAVDNKAISERQV